MMLEKKEEEVLTELDLSFLQLESVIISAEKTNATDIVQGVEIIRGLVRNVTSIGDYNNEYSLVRTLISRFIKNYNDLHNGREELVTKGLIMGGNLVEQYYTCINEDLNERNISNR